MTLLCLLKNENNHPEGVKQSKQVICVSSIVGVNYSVIFSLSEEQKDWHAFLSESSWNESSLSSLHNLQGWEQIKMSVSESQASMTYSTYGHCAWYLKAWINCTCGRHYINPRQCSDSSMYFLGLRNSWLTLLLTSFDSILWCFCQKRDDSSRWGPRGNLWFYFINDVITPSYSAKAVSWAAHTNITQLFISSRSFVNKRKWNWTILWVRFSLISWRT